MAPRLNDLNFAQSFAFWTEWFMENPNVLEGYQWPSTWQDLRVALQGRRCPWCHGTGYKALAPQNVAYQTIEIVYCVCRTLQEMDTEYTSESIWQPEKLSNFKLLKGAGTVRILEAASDFMLRPAMWHYLYGGLGSGKTKLLYALKTHFRGLAFYLNMGNFNNLVASAMNRRNLDYLVEDIASVPILLIDDLGAEYPSEFFYSTLYTIINDRYAMKLKAPTFITSNLTYDELRTSSHMEYKRIADRISDHDLTVTLISKQVSYRQLEQQ